jgi:hypothetical protein
VAFIIGMSVDMFVFVFACGAIAAGAYAPERLRVGLSGLTVSIGAPLVYAGVASRVLGRPAGTIGASLDSIVDEMTDPSLLCKLIFVRLFVFLSSLAEYDRVNRANQVAQARRRTDLANVMVARGKLADPCVASHTSRSCEANSSGCMYTHADPQGDVCKSVGMYDEPSSMLTTRMYGMCGSYFQEGLGATEGGAVKAPFLLTAQFLASLVMHLPNHFTGPPILYTTLTNQLMALYHMQGSTMAERLGAVVPTIAALGEVLMWTWSSALYLVDPNLQACTHSIATAFYVLGNTKLHCFLASIFARFFAPSAFFPSMEPPVFSLRKDGTSDTWSGVACRSFLDGSIATPDSIAANATGRKDTAFFYRDETGETALKNACNKAGMVVDSHTFTHMYCRKQSFSPIMVHTRRQV